MIANILRALSSNDSGGGEGTVASPAPSSTPAPSSNIQSVSSPQKSDAQKMSEAVSTIKKPSGNPLTPKHAVPHQPKKELLNLDFSVDIDDKGDPLPELKKSNTVLDDLNLEIKDETETNTEQLQETETEGDKAEEAEPQNIKAKEDRDLTGFDDLEQKFLRQMSNNAFKFVSSRLRQQKAENEELKGKLNDLSKDVPSSFLNHPSGYTLSPKYGEVSKDLGLAEFVSDHWKDQYAKIKENQPWRALEGFDKNNNPIYSVEYAPNGKAEIDVMGAFQLANTAKDRYSQQIEELKNNFQKSYQDEVSLVDSHLKKTFPWVGNDKLLEEKIETDKGVLPLKSFKEEMIKAIPSSMRDHPLANAVGHMFVALNMHVAKILDLKKKLAAAESTKKQVLRSEPSGGKVPSTQKKESSGDTFDISGMQYDS